MDKIKVLLVEDSPIFAELIGSYLNKEIDIIVLNTANNTQDAIKKALNYNYDMILMDINLNNDEYGGIIATKSIIKDKKDAKIIMLTSLYDKDLEIECFMAGAIQFVSKFNYEALPSLIRAMYHYGDIQKKITYELKKQHDLNLLTPEEQKIYNLAAKGYRSTQICIMMNKETKTFSNQVTSINRKLNIKHLEELRNPNLSYLD